MSAGQAALVIGPSLVILVVMVTVMARLNRTARQRVERRRAAWKAAHGERPCPLDNVGGFGYKISADFAGYYQP